MMENDLTKVNTGLIEKSKSKGDFKLDDLKGLKHGVASFCPHAQIEIEIKIKLQFNNYA